MRIDKAWVAWDRAQRMLKDLSPYASGADKQAFLDRLPYILDLWDGVGREVTRAIQRSGANNLMGWWADQTTEGVNAMNDMRNAELKGFQSRSTRDVSVEINAAPVSFYGKPVNAGETLVTVTWCFVGGRFDGQEVMTVLSEQLALRKAHIEEAEKRLN